MDRTSRAYKLVQMAQKNVRETVRNTTSSPPRTTWTGNAPISKAMELLQNILTDDNFDDDQTSVEKGSSSSAKGEMESQEAVTLNDAYGLYVDGDRRERESSGREWINFGWG
ncbi:uncharacterized protein [Antedon mediterranea]|uniref:uncharacterized protein n=1 Tax=Antedon mediterranea TaxID=105859 RepID=UPI003AF6BFDA